MRSVALSLLLTLSYAALIGAVINIQSASPCSQLEADGTYTAINDGAECFPQVESGFEACNKYRCTAGECDWTPEEEMSGTLCLLSSTASCERATCVVGSGGAMECQTTGTFFPVGTACYSNDCSWAQCVTSPVNAGETSCDAASTSTNVRDADRCPDIPCFENSRCNAGSCDGELRDCFQFVTSQLTAPPQGDFLQMCWRNTLCQPEFVGSNDACNSVLQGQSTVAACTSETTSICIITPTEAVACDDGSLCTIEDVCISGICQGKKLPCTAPTLLPKTWLNDTLPKDRNCYDSFSALADCRYDNGTCFLPLKAEGEGCDDLDAATNYDICVPQGTCIGAFYLSDSIWITWDLPDDEQFSLEAENDNIANVSRVLASLLDLQYASAVRADQIWNVQNSSDVQIRFVIFSTTSNTTNATSSLVSQALLLISQGAVQQYTRSTIASDLGPSNAGPDDELSSFVFSQTSTIVGALVATGMMMIVIAACFGYYGTKASRGQKLGSSQSASTSSSISSSSSRG